MNLMQLLLDESNDERVSELGRRFDLAPSRARSVVEQLTPILGRGLKSQAERPGGLEALTRALSTGQHQRYLDEPARLREPATVTDGNAILGHLLGSKDVSRQVAGQAAERTGVDASVVKKMLPLLAAMVMGAMSKQTASGARLSGLGVGSADDTAGLLGSLLDSDGDGSVADDLFGIASKLLR